MSDEQISDAEARLRIGFASGTIPSRPLNLPLLKGASIVGVFWGSFNKHEPKAGAALLAELVRWYGEGKIKPVIDRLMPMAEVKAAYLEGDGQITVIRDRGDEEPRKSGKSAIPGAR
jgi:NADPH:quinone reductase-like Zn-dependent oxidoreductase